MSRVFLAVVLAVLIPVAARGEPIGVSVDSRSGSATASGDITISGSTIDLGELSLSGDGEILLFIDDARAWRNYTVEFNMTLASGVDGFTAELLDPLGDGDDALDPASLPGYVPSGYSTSNDRDGVSFAQWSGMERSASYAGGSVAAVADEMTHRGDILMFTGLEGVDDARVTFGLRDIRTGGFLLRISAILAETSHTPEPASMLLIGTGLAGLLAARRKRRSTAATAAA